MGERPVEPKSRWQAGRSFLRDAAVGAALGVVLAVLWVVVLMLTHPPERATFNFNRRRVEYGEVGDTYYTVPFREYSWRNLGMGCLVFLAFGVAVTAGAFGGAWMGGRGGAIAVGVAGYFVPFLGFGVYIQRTVGWAAWLDPEAGGGNRGSGSRLTG